MSALKTPLRLRSWHSTTVDDSEGRSVFSAVSTDVAQQIVDIVNAATKAAAESVPHLRRSPLSCTAASLEGPQPGDVAMRLAGIDTNPFRSKK